MSSSRLTVLRHGSDVWSVSDAEITTSVDRLKQWLREGAVLIRGVDDILEGLDGITVTAEPQRTAAPAVEMNDVQRLVWDALATRHDAVMARLHGR